ncbi:MAG: excinuclease ABC subunit A [Pseudomonadota bacterium]|nr:excinuclease ABC subunit A [Pseudomonadota bacterium]MDP1903214.1 excinuclease ABC subunit A [Pseudomonadota bacterium]MDP2352723.1 excinuclease ABC subunit A [Pseudomonadota bacterium]
MNKFLPLTAALLAVSLNAAARDDHKMFPLKDALEAPAAQEKLDKSIKLYFAGQPHPKTIKNLGTWPTNKKTNAFGKSDVEACNWAFLSAVLTLQERARKEGGNAVIDIKSNYRNIETASATEFMCGVGNVVAGVALKGTVAKVAE